MKGTNNEKNNNNYIIYNFPCDIISSRVILLFKICKQNQVIYLRLFYNFTIHNFYSLINYC